MYKNYKNAEFAGNCGTEQRKKEHFVRMMNYKFQQKQDFKRPKYNVPLNIIETEEEFEIHVFATGFSKEDIKISVIDDVLYIKGKKEIDEGNAPKFTRQEFPIKNFERTLSLNGSADAENITASSENGILVIKLPKAQKQIIEVK